MSSLRLVQPGEKPSKLPRIKNLREKYETLVREHAITKDALKAANEVSDELQRKLDELQHIQEEIGSAEELRQLKIDYQQACEERDNFESDAADEHERAEQLEVDKELLLRLLGISEHEFEISRSTLECRRDGWLELVL